MARVHLSTHCPSLQTQSPLHNPWRDKCEPRSELSLKLQVDGIKSFVFSKKREYLTGWIGAACTANSSVPSAAYFGWKYLNVVFKVLEKLEFSPKQRRVFHAGIYLGFKKFIFHTIHNILKGLLCKRGKIGLEYLRNSHRHLPRGSCLTRTQDLERNIVS